MFQKVTLSLVGATAALAGFAQSAEALTLEKSIDFAGAGPDVPFLFFDLGDGLELTVTAGIHSGGPGANAPFDFTAPANVTQSGGNVPGIGVRNTVQENDISQLDAGGPDDFLRFTFNKHVTLLSTIFEAATNVGPGSDEFDLGIDNVDIDITDTFGTDRLRSFPGAGFPGRTDRLVDFSGGVDFNDDGIDDLFPAKGLVFDFYTDDNNDSYRIRELTVAQDVPTPALLPGLIGMGITVLRKRKRQEKA